MVNVTKSNFIAESNDLLSRLPSAAFVAIDEEMTGITLPNSARPSKDHTPSQRYQHLKAVPEKYSIIQLGICLFHQHPDYLESTRRGLPCPEFVAVSANEKLLSTLPDLTDNVHSFSSLQRRYNFYMFPPADNRITREVVLNPSSVSFLNQHNMNFDLWSRQGIPYVTKDVADKLLSKFKKKQTEKREKKDSPNKNPSKFQGRTRVELSRTEDINFHARAMASLREWLDSAQPTIQPRRPRGNQGPEEVPEGLGFLLPQATSFQRRALYEAIQLEYPNLILENAAPQYPDQIRVLRLSPEEQLIREQRLLKEEWEELIVSNLGMHRIFSALSLACQGYQVPFDSITFAEGLDGVNWERQAVDEEFENLVQVDRRIPVIVHNGLMDLMFLLSHFHSHELPATYEEAKKLVHSYFPVIYDTKILSEECTPASLWDGPTYLENLFNRIVQENEEMAIAIDLVPDNTTSNGLGNLARNEEQKHEAAYDAYMTGAVYVGLCHLISSHARYLNESLDPPDLDASVGSLVHLLLDENNKYVTTLFGCNRLYLMQSIYVIDLVSDQDRLMCGMSPESVFRVTMTEPSLKTHDIARCLSGHFDRRMEEIKYEIIWVNDRTWVVGASRKSAHLGDQSLEDDEALLGEHGEIILRVLNHKYPQGSIERWSNFVEKNKDENKNENFSDLQGKGGWFSWASAVFSDIFEAFGWSVGKERGDKKRESVSEGEDSSREVKRRRII